MVDKNKMISIERTKELLPSLKLSDTEAEEIRNVSTMLADLMFEDWHRNKRNRDDSKTIANKIQN